MRDDLRLSIGRLEKSPKTAYCTVSQLATIRGVSPRHLRRLFALALGRSPRRVLSERRLHEAQQALAAHLSVKEVALNLHYKHPGNFSHWFKAKQGVTPSEYVSGLARS
jgi:AraC family transcriptional regulator